MNTTIGTELTALLSVSQTKMSDIARQIGVSKVRLGRALRGNPDALTLDELVEVKRVLQSTIRKQNM